MPAGNFTWDSRLARHIGGGITSAPVDTRGRIERRRCRPARGTFGNRVTPTSASFRSTPRRFACPDSKHTSGSFCAQSDRRDGPADEHCRDERGLQEHPAVQSHPQSNLRSGSKRASFVASGSRETAASQRTLDSFAVSAALQLDGSHFVLARESDTRNRERRGRRISTNGGKWHGKGRYRCEP